MNKTPTSPRRRTLLAAAGAAALTSPLSVLAQGAEEIVIGGSIPLTGVFAFAGVGINAGMGDYVKMLNDAGGIKGRKVKYVPEDTPRPVSSCPFQITSCSPGPRVSLTSVRTRRPSMPNTDNLTSWLSGSEKLIFVIGLNGFG